MSGDADRSLTIRLKVSSADFDAAMAGAGAKVKILRGEVDGLGPSTAKASKGLGDLDTAAQKVSKSTDDSKKKVGLLSLAIVGLGPAIVPVAALAATAGASLGLMGVAGVLAFKGIQTEMAAGTPLGLAYSADMTTVKGVLGSLEQTGAVAFFTATHKAVGMLHDDFPMLNGAVSQFASIGGDVGDHVLSALLHGFTTLEPLLLMVAKGIDAGAASLDKWTSGGGLEKFQQWAEANLPTIAKALVAIAQAIVQFGAASASSGMIATRALALVASVINSIPVDVLNKLVTVAALGYVAFKGWLILEAVSTAVAGFTAKVVALTVAEEGAAGAAVVAKVAQSGFVTSLGAGAAGAAAAIGPLALLTATVLLYKNALDKPNAVQNSMAAGSPSGRTLLSYVGLDPAYKQEQAWKKQDAADQAAALAKEQAAQDLLNKAIATYTGTISDLATQQGISTTVASGYATEFGFTQDAITKGSKSLSDMILVEREMNVQWANAGPALQGYLTALDAYSKSAGTAADKGAFMAATLKASQGDNLAYAGSMAAVATANQTMVSGFTKAEKATVDWKTGVIDFRNAASGPLIQSMQALQDAAAAAASATYQHEVATLGAKQAASDAATVFKNDTYGALVAEATQLGLTKDQAKALADQYFAMPASVTTQIMSIGEQTMSSELDQIGQQLAALSGHPWVSIVTANIDPALAAMQALRANLVALTTRPYYIGVSVGKPGQSAFGAGPASASSIPALPGYTPSAVSGGGQTGGFDGVTPPTETTAANSAAATAAAKAASDAAKAAAKPITVNRSGYQGSVAGFIYDVRTDTPVAASVMAKLSKAMSDAFSLKGIDAKIAATKQSAADLSTAISDSLKSSLNITTVGAGANNPTGYIAGVGNIVSGFKDQTAQNNKFTALENSLNAKGLDKNYLAELEAQGLSAMPTLNALNSGSKSQLAAASAAYEAYQKSVSTAAATGSTNTFGAQLTSFTKTATALTSQMSKLVAAVAASTNRTTTIELDGKVIAKAVGVANKKTTR